MTQPPPDPTQPPPQGPPPQGPPAQHPPPWRPPPGCPPYPPYAYQAPYNTYAILSLVLSIAVFPPLGIYFGGKAKEQIARTGERGIELANVGVILGWVFTAIMGVAILAWCGMMAMMFGGMAAFGA